MNYITAVDFSILDFIQNNIRCGFLDAVMPYITRLGDGGVLWIVLGAALLFFPKTRRCGAAILIGLLLSLLICNVLIKPLVARPRPCVLRPVSDMLIAVPGDYSFPSGHTAAAFITAFTIWLSFKRTGAAMSAVAALIAFSRMYLYVHYPTDILGGIILAVIIVLAVKALLSNKHIIKP